MKALLALAILIAAAQPALAQEDEPDCSDPQDQSTMTLCAGIDFTKADDELNRIWPEVKKDAQENDANAGEGKTEYLDALMASQRAWLAYRDAECTRQGFEAHGGSMEPMLVNGCLATMTGARIKELTAEGLAQ